MAYNVRFGLSRYGQLSDCNRILIFRSEFPVIPRKINEYLRTDFPSDANTRIIRGYCKLLISNNLCLTDTFLHCNKHHFSMRLSPYQGLK